jgi:hypothetical protein
MTQIATVVYPGYTALDHAARHQHDVGRRRLDHPRRGRRGPSRHIAAAGIRAVGCILPAMVARSTVLADDNGPTV